MATISLKPPRCETGDQVLTNQARRSSYYDLSVFLGVHDLWSDTPAAAMMGCSRCLLQCRRSLPDGHLAEGVKGVIFPVKIIVQYRDATTAGTVIRFLLQVIFRIQNNIGRKIYLEFAHDLLFESQRSSGGQDRNATIGWQVSGGLQNR